MQTSRSRARRKTTLPTLNSDHFDHTHKPKQKRKDLLCIVGSLVALVLVLFVIVKLFSKSNTQTGLQAPLIASIVRSTDTVPAVPHLVVVASINGGTSALNAIVLWHFKKFFHGIKTLKDSAFWIECIPEHYTRFGIKQVPNKRVMVSMDNLAAQAADWKTWDYNFDAIKWRGAKTVNPRCDHEEYMQHIGYDLDATRNEFAHVLLNEEQYAQQRLIDQRWPDEAYKNIAYFWERSSGYNMPHVPMIFAHNYPRTKLLYVVRDPLVQSYSRIRHFDEHTKLQKANKNNMTAVEANRRFGKLLEYLKSDQFSVVMSLLQNAGTDADSRAHNADQIVMWFVTEFARQGIRWKNERIFDVCPVINLMVFVRAQVHFVGHVQNFRVLQFEHMSSGSDGLIQSMVRLRCWMEADIGLERNECFRKYSHDGYAELDEIMWNWKDFQTNPHYGKLEGYDVVLSDMKTVDAILDVLKVCDERMLALFEEYPILQLGEFDIDLWSKQRQEFRQKVMANS